MTGGGSAPRRESVGGAARGRVDGASHGPAGPREIPTLGAKEVRCGDRPPPTLRGVLMAGPCDGGKSRWSGPSMKGRHDGRPP